MKNEPVKTDKPTPKKGGYMGEKMKIGNPPHAKRKGTLKNGNPPGDPSKAPRCGAYARTTGKPCNSPAMNNGRCRMHGGASTGPKTNRGKKRAKRGNWKSGKYSAETKRKYKEIRDLLRFNGKVVNFVVKNHLTYREMKADNPALTWDEWLKLPLHLPFPIPRDMYRRGARG